MRMKTIRKNVIIEKTTINSPSNNAFSNHLIGSGPRDPTHTNILALDLRNNFRKSSMPFLDKINTTMKKSKLTKRKKPKAAAATKEIDISDESELSAMMKSHHIDKDQNKTSENLTDPAVNNVVEQNRNEEMETELRNIRDENQYLKLLLGMSYKVDQLYEIWHGHFPNAFSSKNNLKTYLDLHSKQKQSDLIVKTFEHVQTIKQFLTEHKIQMIAPSGSEQISNNSENVLGMGRNSSELLESGHSGAQESIAILDNASTSSTGDQRKAEISSNSQQRQDLGRMLSQEVFCYKKME